MQAINLGSNVIERGFYGVPVLMIAGAADGVFCISHLLKILAPLVISVINGLTPLCFL